MADAHEIIRMANANYPRGGIPLPGPCGGPCLTKDGYFLVEDLIFPDFILTAWKLNEGVPAHMVRRLKQSLEQRGSPLSDATVIVLGMGFKAESDDIRMSPAIRTAELLRAEGAAVTVCDPYFETPDIASVIKEADAVVLPPTTLPSWGLIWKLWRDWTRRPSSSTTGASGMRTAPRPQALSS
jgi:UDP-N-acetyl-D-mannosaminuronate dehydrogenase